MRLSIAESHYVFGDNLSSGEKGNDTDVIFVNNKPFEVSAESLTGSQILQLGTYDPSQYDLFLVHGQKDELIGSTQSVDIENGLHFNAILKNVPYGG